MKLASGQGVIRGDEDRSFESALTCSHSDMRLGVRCFTSQSSARSEDARMEVNEAYKDSCMTNGYLHDEAGEVPHFQISDFSIESHLKWWRDQAAFVGEIKASSKLSVNAAKTHLLTHAISDISDLALFILSLNMRNRMGPSDRQIEKSPTARYQIRDEDGNAGAKRM